MACTRHDAAFCEPPTTTRCVWQSTADVRADRNSERIACAAALTGDRAAVPSRSTDVERPTPVRGIRYNRGVTAVRLMALCVVAACGFRSGEIPDGGATHDVIDDSGAGSDVLPLDASVEVVALVQQVTGYAPNSNAPLAATLPSLPAAGHLLVMIGAAEHGGLTSVTGGGVATWTRATRSLSNTNVEVWFGVTDGSSATVTVTFPAFGLPMWLAVTEWSGMAK